MAEIRPDEVVIEIDHPKNSNVYFHPLHGPENTRDVGLRSAVIPTRSGPGMPQTFFSISRIPGQRVHVNPKTMKARISDALADQDNAAILRQVKHAAASFQKSPWEVGDPAPDYAVTLHTQEDLHNWLYWMRRLVDDGHATLLQGSLPTAEALRNSGDIRAPAPNPAVARAEYGGPYLPPLEDPFGKSEGKPAMAGAAK